MMRLFAVTLFLLSMGSAALGENAPQVFVLKNGFHVVFQKRAATPLVALELWVRGGSREERGGENGAAHFIEHLVFRREKGTSRESPDTAIENLGGTLSAANALDYARFSTTVASAHFGKAIAIVSDVVRNAEFPAKELELERGIILEELAIRSNPLEEQIQFGLYSQLFPFHPYRLSPGGKPDSIEKLSRETLLAFFRRNYRPERCVLVAVGSIEFDQVYSEAVKVFDNWIAPAALPDAPANETPPAPAKTLTLYARGTEPQFGMGYVAPASGDILDALTGQVTAAIINARLQRNPRFLKPSVQYTPRLDRSLFQIQAQIDVSDTKLAIPLDMKERYERAEATVRGEIARLQTTPPTQVELNAACREMLGRFLVDTETNSGMAQFWAYHLVTRGRLGNLPVQELPSVRPQTVQEFARAVLTRESIVHLLPDRSPPQKEAKP